MTNVTLATEAATSVGEARDLVPTNRTPALAAGASVLRFTQHDNAKVSVIIPTYNRRHLLAHTLGSVYQQEQSADEIIVVDDGSTDGTYIMPTNRLVYHRIEHSGASTARNVGLNLARGEYIAFLDSDDVWEKQFLERMTAALDAAPWAGWVYCDYATFNASGLAQSAYLRSRHKVRGDVFTSLLETDFLSTGALLIRRECFARVGGFDPALAVTHDWDLWLRIAHQFDAEYVDEPLVRIRIDSNGLTRNTPQLYADNLRVMNKWQRSAARNAQQRQFISRNVRACHRALFRYSWTARRPLRALAHFSMMLATL